MIKFIAVIIKLGIVLAMMGQLQTMILVMAGKTAIAQKNMISYSKFTRALTSESAPRKKVQHR